MAQKTIWRLYHTRASQAEQEARGSAACVRACVCCSGRRRGPGSSSSDWLLGGLISRIITGFSSGGGAPFSVAHEAKKKPLQL